MFTDVFGCITPASNRAWKKGWCWCLCCVHSAIQLPLCCRPTSARRFLLAVSYEGCSGTLHRMEIVGHHSGRPLGCEEYALIVADCVSWGFPWAKKASEVTCSERLLFTNMHLEAQCPAVFVALRSCVTQSQKGKCLAASPCKREHIGCLGRSSHKVWFYSSFGPVSLSYHTWHVIRKHKSNIEPCRRTALFIANVLPRAVSIVGQHHLQPCSSRT